MIHGEPMSVGKSMDRMAKEFSQTVEETLSKLRKETAYLLP